MRSPALGQYFTLIEPRWQTTMRQIAEDPRIHPVSPFCGKVWTTHLGTTKVPEASSTPNWDSAELV